MMPRDERIVVVGAGPAGTRAVETLLAAGCTKITVINEAPASGGQIYRRQPGGFSRSADLIYGDEAPKALHLHRTFDGLSGRIVHRSRTVVWNVFDGAVYTSGPAGAEVIPYDRLVLCTGAMDRILPVPGWTLPGVFTLGGAQIALKHQACSIGRSVVFAGTGPLLYLVAYQYVKAGANVLAVLDAASFADKVKASVLMAAAPGQLLRGLAFRRYLARNGVALHEGARPQRIEGGQKVEGVRFTARGRTHDIECDAVGLGFGLNSEMQLAEITGCRIVFDSLRRQWTVGHDGQGRAGAGVYIAGDGAAIGGADVAELAGERAALALLSDLGVEPAVRRQSKIRRSLARHARFRAGVDTAFAYPYRWIKEQPDETILCRCENVTFGDVRAAIARFEPSEVNRLKALARPGMGRCQGRVCGPVLAELLAATTGKPLDEVGKLRGQAPVKPVSYDAIATLASPEVNAWMEPRAGEKK